MAMTGQKVPGGLVVSLIAMSASQAQPGIGAAALQDLARRLTTAWNAPLIPVFPSTIPAASILSVGLLRVQQAAHEGAGAAEFTVAVAFVGDSADGSLPDSIVGAVPWADLAAQHATPLDAGQRSSGRFPRPRMT